MTRNRRSARNAGTRFERVVADYLNHHVDDHIDRRAKSGARDKGDIGGLRHMGNRVVVECKDTTRPTLGPWVTEVDIERGNDDAAVGIVVHKRVGRGHPGDQLVTMTLRDLVTLLSGSRPDEAS